MKQRAFTLVEIMIVVLIIGILMGIAVPNYVRSRAQTQRNSCISNLRALEQAKELYVYDQQLQTGDTVDAAAAWAAYAKTPYPTCQAGGTYTVNVVGTPVVCSLAAAPNLHAMP